MLYMQFAGLLLLTVALHWLGGWGRLADGSGFRPWAWGILVGVLNTCGTLALYHENAVARNCGNFRGDCEAESSHNQRRRSWQKLAQPARSGTATRNIRSAVGATPSAAMCAGAMDAGLKARLYKVLLHYTRNETARPTHRREMTESYCNVALPVPLRTTFTYAVPDAMRAQVQPGSRVLVPFRKKAMVGVVVDMTATAPERTKIREIQKVLDLLPVLTPKLLELGQWVANYYLAPVGEVFRAMLPPATDVALKRQIVLTDAGRTTR